MSELASLEAHPPRTIDEERDRRINLAAALSNTHPDGRITAQVLRDLRIYYGARGIWINAARTRSLDPRGVTVSVLHTGVDYADDLSEDGIIYSYPRTDRPGHDRAEITATKATFDLQIPIFVISHDRDSPNRRNIRLGWVNGWIDDEELFLITFTQQSRTIPLDRDRSDESPFEMFLNNKRKRAQRSTTVREGQKTFKFEVLQRYGARCPLSGVSVPGMLDAAHIVPVASNGSDDPRNGLLLNAALHRAFDSHFFTIHPDTYEVVTKPGGPKVEDLGVTQPNISHLHKLPDRDALRWRYNHWLEKTT